MAITRIGAAAAFSLLVVGSAAIGSASAQSSSPGAMPLPPSARDPLPKEEPRAGTRTNSRANRAKAGTATNSSSSSPNYRDRIEGQGDLQLEDDPRVRPTMEGGRPGVGMRF